MSDERDAYVYRVAHWAKYRIARLATILGTVYLATSCGPRRAVRAPVRPRRVWGLRLAELVVPERSWGSRDRRAVL